MTVQGMAASAMALGLALQAGSAQAPSLPPPVFRGGADMVLVDAVVTDRKDRPIADLTRGDFRVYEDGVERDILSFVAFGAPPTPSTTTEPSTTAPLETVRTNPIRSVPASTVVFVDEGHMTGAEAAKLRAGLAGVVRALFERKGAVLVLAPWSRP